MAAEWFDDLVRSIAGGVSRRTALRGFVAAVGGVLAGAETTAAGKPKKKTCKKTTCGNKCVDTRTDRKNCGKCGNRCTGKTTCSSGKCRCADANQEVCGKRCIDTRTDPKNCGKCGNKCPGELTCSAGKCQCEKVACLVEVWDNDDGPAGEYGSAGIAVDRQHLFVVDSSNNRILKFTTSGEFVKAWGRFGVDDAEFQYPAGVAVDAAGDVYVSDNGNDRIQKFSGEGTFLAKWAPDEIGYPNGIAVSASGDVCIADGELVVLDSNGSFLRSWYGIEPNGPYFSAYNQIAIDRDDHLYIPDYDENTLSKYTLEGDFVWMVGETGDEPGEFNSPQGVAVDNSGRVFVADRNNRRVQVLDDTGGFLFEWDDSYPEWLAVDEDGYVFTSNGSISKFVLGPKVLTAVSRRSPHRQR